MITRRFAVAPTQFVAVVRFYLTMIAVLVLTSSVAEAQAGPIQQDARAALAGTSSPYAAHYIVFEKDADGVIRPRYYAPIQWSGPGPTGLRDAELAAALAGPSRNTEHLAAAVISDSGEILFQTAVDVPRWLRGEYHGANPGDPIEGYLLTASQPAFVVRVPAITGATLVLRDAASAPLARFDLDQLARTTPRSELSRGAGTASQATGNAANRVDLLVMGDGYTSAQQSKFSSDAAGVLSSFFDITPHSEYSNYYNLHTLFTASQQSGADHPPYQAGCWGSSCCGDTAMLSDPLAGTWVNTAFDAAFCAYNIHRLLMVSSSKVYAAAAAVPDWDEILVIVNDTTYGGSGGVLTTISMHSSAPQIAIHEYGHAFAGLADEYEDAYPGYPVCSDLGGSSPCEANVTDVTGRSQIKWSPWISDTTPIPTTPEMDPQWANVVGLFEGARYRATGIYRSGQNCIMRSLGRPYCQAPGQAYILKLYTGGWGVPAGGVRLIEPGTAVPASSVIILPPGQSQAFHADILQPSGGPAARIQWLVNDVADLSAHTDTFVYTRDSSVTGNVEIKLLVEDATSLVHSQMAGDALRSSYTWTVRDPSWPLIWLPMLSRK